MNYLLGYVQERRHGTVYTQRAYSKTENVPPAKREFGLTDKDIATLPFQGYAASPKCVYAVEQLMALAKLKYKAIGVRYPLQALPDEMTKLKGMTKTSEKLTGLAGRSSNAYFRF